jgi:hypothetical protein
MIEVSVKHTLDKLSARLGNLVQERKVAVAIALTATAQDVREAEYEEMKRVFDRPTRFTLSSLFLKRATAADLRAVVWLREQWPNPRVHYLSPQIHGGQRPLKRFEHLLQAKGLLPAGMAAVPGRGARFDANGNMSRGQLIQVLSSLQAMGEHGYAANRTNSARSRRSAKRAGQYFVGRPGGGRLPLGVWHKRGEQLLPVLIFVPVPKYSKRFDFYGVANKVVARNFHGNLIAALSTRGRIR